jgi:hypothetical protein
MGVAYVGQIARATWAINRSLTRIILQVEGLHYAGS